MKNKYGFVAVLLLAVSLMGFGFTRVYLYSQQQSQEEDFCIVTSFYPMYIATENIVGNCEGVSVQNLSEPQTGCLHDYQLTPQDMILLGEADVFVVNGGGMEAFLEDVISQYPSLKIIHAGEGIFEEDHEKEDYEDEEDDHGHSHSENAHVWMSSTHYLEQIENIKNGLAEADKAHAKEYEQAADIYVKEIQKLQQEMAVIAETIEGKNVISFHEAFTYLAEDYGLHIQEELNLDEDMQVSAGEVADILNAIEKYDISVVFAEETYGKKLGETIEKSSNCKVYYLDTLVRGDKSAESWLVGMKHNLQQIKEAFQVKE